MRIAVFLILMLVAIGYAARKGGGPERAMAIIAATMIASDQALHLLVPPEFASLDIGHLAIDLFGASATMFLALVAYRFWPMIAAALHILPLLAHLSRYFDIMLHPAAYLTMQVASSWPVGPILIVATWGHQRRIRQFGSDPSWRGSSPSWNRGTAKP
ncbi:hypothetical protein [Sphingopyxis sp.]|uniref:hypothetical protein n=1 Tax=Sphingopyxis sp. TaxID=1908224 RepID=UPI003BACCA17